MNIDKWKKKPKTMNDIREMYGLPRIKKDLKEIEELKAQLEMYENGVYFSSENDKLQARIDKAIEHLKESINDYLKDDRDIDGTCNVMCFETIKKRYLKPVIDILQGSDKDD